MDQDHLMYCYGKESPREGACIFLDGRSQLFDLLRVCETLLLFAFNGDHPCITIAELNTIIILQITLKLILILIIDFSESINISFETLMAFLFTDTANLQYIFCQIQGR